MLDKILFGKNNTEGIIDVHLKGDSIVEYRLVDGKIEKSIEKFYPFFFLSDINLIKGFDERQFVWAKLKGNNFYKYLCVFYSWQMYNNAKYYVTAKNRDAVYTVPNPEQQYLMQTGKTLFKGLVLNDLKRLQFDIETYSPGRFPTSKKDPIIIIAVSTNKGLELLLCNGEKKKNRPERENWIWFDSEKKLLEGFVRLIKSQDPDILETFNGYKFDIPYIEARCHVNSIPFDISRDGSYPTSFETTVRFAERKITYPKYTINGRHIIDAYFNVLADDVYRRDMQSHTLKYSAKYYGFANEDREYVDGSQIWRVWDDNPERLLRYATDDVIETRAISEHLTGSSFYLTQMIPMRYSEVAVSGNGAKIESLFAREYLDRKESIPRKEEGEMTTGGLTKVFRLGLYEPILYADVESLYPSIMLNYNIQPERDHLKLFPYMLQLLTDLRFRVKNEMKGEEDKIKRSELDSRQNSFKILINSFFGVLGFKYFPWNDYSEADRVTKTGQINLRQIVSIVERKGGIVIEMDTDGILFVPPDNVYVSKSKEDIPDGMVWDMDFVKGITTEMPKGINIGFDGRFKRMFSYAKKNYALLGFDGKMKVKGGAFKNRKEEKFGRDFVNEVLTAILNNDIDKIHETYLAFRSKILKGDWTIDDFSKTITLTESLNEYENKLLNTNRTPDPHYEVAKRYGRKIDKGDRVSYYIAGIDKGVTSYKAAKHIDDYNGDENKRYYLNKLDDFAYKFKDFFEEFDYRMIFNENDMFGFTSKGIKVKQIDVTMNDNST